MRVFAGFILCSIGTIFGLYVGLWLLFIGGIADMADAIIASLTGDGTDGINKAQLFLGLLKVTFSYPVGTIAMGVFTLPGIDIMLKRK